MQRSSGLNKKLHVNLNKLHMEGNMNNMQQIQLITCVQHVISIIIKTCLTSTLVQHCLFRPCYSLAFKKSFSTFCIGVVVSSSISQLSRFSQLCIKYSQSPFLQTWGLQNVDFMILARWFHFDMQALTIECTFLKVCWTCLTFQNTRLERSQENKTIFPIISLPKLCYISSS